jgi:hypothetical protein
MAIAFTCECGQAFHSAPQGCSHEVAGGGVRNHLHHSPG